MLLKDSQCSLFLFWDSALHVAPVGFKLNDLPASISRVLTLQIYATHIQPNCLNQYLGIYSCRNYRICFTFLYKINSMPENCYGLWSQLSSKNSSSVKVFHPEYGIIQNLLFHKFHLFKTLFVVYFNL